MAGLTFIQLFLDLPKAILVIKDFLDKPAEEYLKESTITQILNRSYNTVFVQTTIDVGNQSQVTDVINAITVWQTFGAYMNSMPEILEETNKFEFLNKLKHYKDIAVGLGNILGIAVSGEKIKLDVTQIIASGSGISNLKDTNHFDGAHDNNV